MSDYSSVVSKVISLEDKKLFIIDNTFDVEQTCNIFDNLSRSRFEIDFSTNTISSKLQPKELLTCDFFNSLIIRDVLQHNQFRITNICLDVIGIKFKSSYRFITKKSKTLLFCANKYWDSKWGNQIFFSLDGCNVDYVSEYVPGRIFMFDSSLSYKISNQSISAETDNLFLRAELINSQDYRYEQSYDFLDFFYNKKINLTEHERLCLDILKQSTENISHLQTNLFDHLYNTFIILKHLKMPPIVCLAGLFHSIYCDDIFGVKIFKDRSELVELIGDIAESYVFEYSDADSYNNIVNNKRQYEPRVQLDLLYIFYANLIDHAFKTNIEPYHTALVETKKKIITLELELECKR